MGDNTSNIKEVIPGCGNLWGKNTYRGRVTERGDASSLHPEQRPGLENCLVRTGLDLQSQKDFLLVNLVSV